MYHINFHPQNATDNLKVAFFTKLSALNKDSIHKAYIQPINDILPDEHCIAIQLLESATKTTVSQIKEYTKTLFPNLNKLNITTLVVTDSSYFKVWTNSKQADKHIGYVLACTIPDYEHFSIVYVPSYQTVFYDPKQQSKIDLALNAITCHLTGSINQFGKNFIHSAYYPTSYSDILALLKKLIKYPELAVDIEAYSLDFWQAGIATISFAWNQHEACSFSVDLSNLPNATNSLYKHELTPNYQLREALRQFFTKYRGTTIWHNASYDIKVLVFNLFMKNKFNAYAEMVEGIRTMTRQIHDTKIIAYLATNSTARNVLSLKALAHEHSGNYALEEINNIAAIPETELLEYNLIDSLSTFYVFNKYYPIAKQDKQLRIYYGVLLPSLKTIIQMELVGMPLNSTRVRELNDELTKHRDSTVNNLFLLSSVLAFQQTLRQEEFEATNAKWKKKSEPLSYFDYVSFNPGSNQQLQRLIYEYLGYAVIDTTDTGAPATGKDTIKKLLNHSKSADDTQLFKLLIDLSDVDIIINNFLHAFITRSVMHEDGWWWIHGNFNLGGTVSGRLSSSNPNMQNIPSSGSKYASVIKECFQAPPGWVLSGSDFASLEDRVSALQTKDPNKLKVYTDGFDGHCLRAYTYFSEQMPDIDPDSVDSINSIQDHPQYAVLRQDSKAPTFALTYQGTWITLVNNCGFTKEVAQKIEAKYHELYAISDQWVQDQLQKASQVGYIECAFGLRIRTPLLQQCIWGSSRTPYEALKEGRTAGNALGQSYGLLNNRAAVSYQTEYWNTEHKYSILPTCHIHDAQYFLLKQDLDVILYHNNRMRFHMSWVPEELYHPEVGLGGDVELFYPSWKDKLKLPKEISKFDLLLLLKKHGEKFR
jgi:DNA polymerase-1